MSVKAELCMPHKVKEMKLYLKYLALSVKIEMAVDV